MRTIQISAKCSDMFWGRLKDGEEIIGEYDGYVPDFMPGEHYGDYVELTIDIDTGKIVNWQTPTGKDLKIFQPKA